MSVKGRRSQQTVCSKSVKTVEVRRKPVEVSRKSVGSRRSRKPKEDSRKSVDVSRKSVESRRSKWKAIRSQQKVSRKSVESKQKSVESQQRAVEVSRKPVWSPRKLEKILPRNTVPRGKITMLIYRQRIIQLVVEQYSNTDGRCLEGCLMIAQHHTHLCFFERV